jgi:ribosome-associated protein
MINPQESMANPPAELARTIADALEDKKGEDILLLDLTEICSFTDFFVVCSANNERTLRALADEIRTRMKASYSILPHHVEGEPSSGWVLLDYGDVILHLFLTATRNYYRLEDLWRHGKVLLHMP